MKSTEALHSLGSCVARKCDWRARRRHGPPLPLSGSNADSTEPSQKHTTRNRAPLQHVANFARLFLWLSWTFRPELSLPWNLARLAIFPGLGPAALWPLSRSESCSLRDASKPHLGVLPFVCDVTEPVLATGCRPYHLRALESRQIKTSGPEHRHERRPGNAGIWRFYERTKSIGKHLPNVPKLIWRWAQRNHTNQHTLNSNSARCTKGQNKAASGQSA